ncbi:MAG TPA: uroporphyrinogen-III synthase [Solirubrobacteraceae bacterium]|nr:uroporphyrinogen-III synthase [Solirubrobacteraceae bacterium]
MAFESRRAPELENLIQRHGGLPIVVPAMREVPLETNTAALELLHRLEAGEIDTVILLTGVGLRTLVDTLSEACPPERLATLLATATLVARGPKPVAELRRIGLTPHVRVPEPNTWHELLSTLDVEAPVARQRVAVLEYGVANDELIDGLVSRTAQVLRVPLYRWALPEDTGPLREAVSRLAGGSVDFLLFTSSRQVDHVMEIAAELSLADAVHERTIRLVVASIGPVCTETLRRHGLPVDLEPEHPKMGHLLVAVARRGRELLEAKRAAAPPQPPTPDVAA